MARGKKSSSRGKRSSLRDGWIDGHPYLAPEKLHALGVITVWWNACETHLLVLFMMVAQLQPLTGWIIAHDLGDASLSERIRELAKARIEVGSLADDVIVAINRILKVYDICRQNRNALTHFKMEVDGDGEGRLVRMKGPSMIRHPLPGELEQFRRIADEIRLLANGIRRLWQNIESRNKGRVDPLPPSPAVPELLWKPIR